MERAGLVLAGLAAGGENVAFTPVQVQKLFFLIDREIAHLIAGPLFGFRPYDYGPFDRAVYDELDSLERIGLVRVQDSGPYRQYLLTSEGYARGVSELSGMGPIAQSYVRSAAAWVKKLNFQQLVAAIYTHFPDMKVNSVFRP